MLEHLTNLHIHISNRYEKFKLGNGHIYSIKKTILEYMNIDEIRKYGMTMRHAVIFHIKCILL